MQLSLEDGWLYVGAWPDLHVTLDDPTVSRRHARLRRTATGFLVEDLGSVNGTWVNGARIAVGQPTPVQSGQTVLLGRCPLDLDDPRLRQGSGAAADLGGVLQLGADRGCDLVFDQPMVSRRHAEVWSERGAIWIRDGALEPRGQRKASANGTWVDGTKISGPTPLRAGSHVHLGSFAVPQKIVRSWWSDRPIGVRQRSAAEVTSLTLPAAGEVKIGRDPAMVDVVLDDPRVSALHAIVRIRPGHVEILDVNSNNGVLVNGQRVHGTMVLPPGADVMIGPVPLDLREGRVGAGVVGLARGIRLRAMGISFAVDDPAFDLVERRALLNRAKVMVRKGLMPWGLRLPRRNLLEPMSLALGPGEVIAVMGTSGAGKSTLLRVLSGYKRPETGRVLADGVELRHNFARFAHRIGNVPQDDIMHRDLTVEQVLTYTGRLRMPGYSAAQVAKRVKEVLADLQLTAIASSTVGDPVSGGISGGQRRRVNIAMELMRQPDLLFLDEPTSGLDSHSTEHVLSLVRDLADGGCTVVMTIHQPGESALRKIDHLLLVGKGRGSERGRKGGQLLYLGPLGDAEGYFRDAAQATLGHEVATGGSTNTAEFVLDVVNEHPNVPALADVYDRSPARKEFFGARPEEAADAGRVAPDREDAPRVSWPAQWLALASRNLHLKVADWKSLTIQMAQPLILLGLMAFLFGDVDDVFGERGLADPQPLFQALFMLSAAALWLGCSNAAREIVAERAIFIRELHWGLSSTAYLASKFAVQGLICLVQMAILAAVGPLVGLPGGLAGYPALLGMLYLGAVCGTGLGLLLSSRASSELMAVAMVPLVLLPQLLLSGFLPLFDKMPAWLQGVSHFVPLRWIFELLMRSEAGRLEGEVCRSQDLWWDVESPACRAAGEQLPLGDSLLRDVYGTATLTRSSGSVEGTGGVERLLAPEWLDGVSPVVASAGVLATLATVCVAWSAMIMSRIKRVEKR